MADKIKLGLALCGSFCTIDSVLRQVDFFCKEYDVYPIMSETAAHTDSRFGTAESFIRRMEQASGRKVICSIAAAEPIGPKKMLDILVVAPCTGNTIAKLARGIADSSVTLAVKAHLRNSRPVVIGISTNDGLAAAAQNIGMLMNRKGYFFVPFGQDDAAGKPRSLVADMSKISDTVTLALRGEQIQPMLLPSY